MDEIFECLVPLVSIVEEQQWFFRSQVLVRVLMGIMIYIVSFFIVGLVLGLVAVASNPSPYYAALGLVVAAGAGC